MGHNFPPFNCFCLLVIQQLYIIVWFYFQVLYSVPFIYVSILPPILHRFNYGNFIISLEFGSTDSSLFSFQNCFSSSIFFYFPCKFAYIYKKILTEILITMSSNWILIYKILTPLYESYNPWERDIYLFGSLILCVSVL